MPHNRAHIRQKLSRIRSGAPIRVLDLFGGCGGLSLGFYTAGFQIIGNVEIDPIAAQSHAANFFRSLPSELQAIHAKARDITKIEPEGLLAEFNITTPLEDAVDMIVGGPPCQAYARVGRAKLREIAEHPEAYKEDPRGNLYLRFLHYVESLQPLAIVMENVPDAINFGGHNIAEETCEALQQRGYKARYTLLNSAFYGVPQMRDRMVLIAIAHELHANVTLPRPTHWIQLPKGYESSRQVALKHLELDLLGTDPYYIPAPQPTRDLKPAVTAKQALSDLPEITGHLNGAIKRGARRLDRPVPYQLGIRLTHYAKQIRFWKGFKSGPHTTAHVIRYTPRDFALFRDMDPGDEYPQAYALALRKLEAKLASHQAAGTPVELGSLTYQKLLAETVPPYDPKKFPNKWRKMEADQPARTLMAHLGKDAYSHIHYDDQQARTISVREAARLQSFPDAFTFCGTMNPGFRQIGNAVPPLMALAIARIIKRQLLRPAPDGAMGLAEDRQHTKPRTTK